MSDAIDRQAAIDAMEQAKEQYFDRRVIIGKMQDIVNNLPSAHPERKKGKWMEENTRSASYIFKCSCCGKNAYFVHGKGRGRNCENRYCGYDFCPNCGANMRGE